MSPSDGRHNFDFLIGSWTVTHRRLRERLAGCTSWDEFGGTSAARPILGGLGNVDDNLLELPGAPYRAATLRLFDPAKGLWSIWWIAGRRPSLVDPPVQGRFAAGVGRFLGEHLAYLKEGFSFSGYERDLVCLNTRDGKFLDISGASGADSISDGRDAVFLDYDDDGDLDIFLRAMHGPAHFLFRNEVGQRKKAVRVEILGTRSGRDAFGTVVRMGTSQGTLARLKSGGCGYLAQHDPRLHFGLGSAKTIDRVEVRWPNGNIEVWTGVEPNRIVTLTEGTGRPVPSKTGLP